MMAVLEKFPNWAISLILAKNLFLIWIGTEIIVSVKTPLQMVSQSVIGSVVFFIWCWFILSLWKKDG
jgi:hypothetical protein